MSVAPTPRGEFPYFDFVLCDHALLSHSNIRTTVVSNFKFHPMVCIDTQMQLISNGLTPVFSIHAETSSFLDELPPVTNHDYFSSSFQLFIVSSYIYRTHDLCNMIYATFLSLNKECSWLDKRAEHIKSLPKPMQEETEESYYNQVVYYRELDSFNTQSIQLSETKNFAVQGFIVQLWALNEKTISRILKLFISESKIKFKIPSSWDGFNAVFSDLGIDTKLIPTIFSTLDELRVLNNKIKHLGEVDSRLAKFDAFKSHEGKSIDGLELNLQRYLNCSYAFFIFLSEQLSSKALSPSLRSQLLTNKKYTELPCDSNTAQHPSSSYRT